MNTLNALFGLLSAAVLFASVSVMFMRQSMAISQMSVASMRHQHRIS